jgi:exodeoxyribonuclease V alpha subunit
VSEPAPEVDRFDARRAIGAAGLLETFNAAGVLAAADVHVARRLSALLDEQDETVQLAVALAVRGPRLGHVYVDLASAARSTIVESEEPVALATLPWPAVADWRAKVAASPLVADGETTVPASPRPLRLAGSRLYLDRYFNEERRIAADIAALSTGSVDDVNVDLLADGIARLFPDAGPNDRQTLAAATALLRRFSVIAGGPGTGKTTTVARIAALLVEQASSGGAVPSLIALAAPTGKAAARLQEAMHEQAALLSVDVATRAALLELSASTLHRLLGWRPDSSNRFRHHRANRLPHDVIIVDETSMVSLSLMSRLVEAVRPGARLILVGDPGQLTSIEAGAVLGDIVGPALEALTMSAGALTAVQRATRRTFTVTAAPAGQTIGDCIVVLDHVHRFGGTIAALATAISTADPDAAIALLASGAADVTWLPVDVATADAPQLNVVKEHAVESARAMIAAATAGDATAALAALGAFRVLCAHRRGPYGAAHWMATITRWLARDIDAFDPTAEWYVGRPLMVTENDYSLKLYNGDVGVVVATDHETVTAAFERQGQVVRFSPTRLAAIDTVYAMTIHKSQGSQFGAAAVLLPPADSPILTRELLYTAVTRASRRLIVAGSEATIRQAIERPAARASALGKRLWGQPGRT